MKLIPHKGHAGQNRTGQKNRLFFLAVCLLSAFVLGGCAAKDTSPDRQAAALPTQTPRKSSVKTETEAPEAEYLYTFFENGNLSSATGEESNSNRKPVRSKHYISVHDFIRVKLRDGYYVRVFAYDGSYAFLGAINNKTRVDQETVVRQFPQC